MAIFKTLPHLETVFWGSCSCLEGSKVLRITVLVLFLVLPLLSWSCEPRPRQFETPGDWWDPSIKTHCHYQLVDVQPFCHLIHLYLFWLRYIRHLPLTVEEMYLWHSVSARMDSLPPVVRSWDTVWSWDSIVFALTVSISSLLSAIKGGLKCEYELNTMWCRIHYEHFTPVSVPKTTKNQGKTIIVMPVQAWFNQWWQERMRWAAAASGASLQGVPFEGWKIRQLFDIWHLYSGMS